MVALKSSFVKKVIFIFIILFLNQHFNRFVVWFPILLIPALIRRLKKPRQFLNKLGEVLPQGVNLFLFLYLSTVLVTSLRSPFRTFSLSLICITVVGPLFLAGFSGTEIWSLKDKKTFVKVAVLGGAFLALTDIAHYFRDFIQFASFSTELSHRWFSDGYIFYFPFFFIFRESLEKQKKLFFNVLLILIYVLISGTGSRSVVLSVSLEIIAMALLNRRTEYLMDLCCFWFTFIVSTEIFPREIGFNTFVRGVSDNNRLIGHWIPAIKMSGQSLTCFLGGHGFGWKVWDYFISQLPNHPWPGLGGPHNMFLQALFAGGVFALLWLVGLLFQLVKFLYEIQKNLMKPERDLAVAGLVALLGFYLISGQFGDPRPEPLMVITLVSIIVYRGRTNASGLKNQSFSNLCKAKPSLFKG